MPSRTSWGRNLTTPVPRLPRPPLPFQHTAEYVNNFAPHQLPPHFQVQNGGWYPNVDTGPQQSYPPMNGVGHNNTRQYLSPQREFPPYLQGPEQMQHQQHQVMAQRQQQLEQGHQVVQALRPLPLEGLVQGEGQDGTSSQTTEKKSPSKSIAEDDISKVHEDKWDPDHWTAGLHCSVCFELYTESYVLQCGHTWCNTCIEAMMKSEKQRTPRRPMDYIPVVCPSCRHSQPYGQYSRYAPRNRALEEAVDAWRKSPDRVKLHVVKDDIGVQVNLDLDDLEGKAVPPPKAMSVQTEQWQPEKTYMSIGHQVCLPAEGSTIGTQTTRGTRDADVQTTPTKQRTKCTQTMFTRTRASGVQVGPPGGLVTTLIPANSTSNTPQRSGHTPPPMTLRPATPPSNTAIPPVSPSNAALGNLSGSLLDRSESAAAILTLTPPPTPPSPASSRSASATRAALSTSRTKARRWRDRRKKGVENKIKRALFTDPRWSCPHEELSLEYFLGDDLADVVRPLMGFDVIMVVALAFHLVFDWRHLLSTVVRDVPTIGSDPYYTTYTMVVMGDAIFVWCIGALGFLYGAMVFLRDAGCWLLEKI